MVCGIYTCDFQNKLYWVLNQICVKPYLRTRHDIFKCMSQSIELLIVAGPRNSNFMQLSKLWDDFQKTGTHFFTSGTMTNTNFVPGELRSWNKLAGKMRFRFDNNSKMSPCHSCCSAWYLLFCPLFSPPVMPGSFVLHVSEIHLDSFWTCLCSWFLLPFFVLTEISFPLIH